MSSLVLPYSPAHAPASHGSPQSLSTCLTDWPDDATFQILRKPVGGITPVNSGKIHIGELIPKEGTFVLVCIEDVADRSTLKSELGRGHDLGIPVIMVGGGATDFLASALYSSWQFLNLHRLTPEPKQATIFVPNNTLCRILKINFPGMSGRVHNALILIQNGRVLTSWISDGEEEQPHNWTAIEKALKSNSA